MAEVLRHLGSLAPRCEMLHLSQAICHAGWDARTPIGHVAPHPKGGARRFSVLSHKQAETDLTDKRHKHVDEGFMSQGGH